MYMYENGDLPMMIWMDMQEYYSDAGVVTQLERLSRHPFVYHHVSLTPDGHAGYGMPIGGVACFDGAVCPNACGVDIACGMLAYPLGIKVDQLNSENLLKIIHQVKRDVPMGMNRHKQSEREIVELAEQLVSQFYEVDD